MDRLRSRSSDDDQARREPPMGVIAVPGPMARRSGSRTRSAGRMATRVLLLFALAASSLTLTHCRMVGDRLTGVEADLLRRKDECKARCQEEFKARNQAEDRLNEQNVQACAGSAACLAAEDARHEAAMRASKLLRDACMEACEHQQGGGSGGR